MGDRDSIGSMQTLVVSRLKEDMLNTNALRYHKHHDNAEKSKNALDRQVTNLKEPYSEQG